MQEHGNIWQGKAASRWLVAFAMCLLFCQPLGAFPTHHFDDSAKQMVKRLQAEQAPERTRTGTLESPARISSVKEAEEVTLESTAVVVLGGGSDVLAELAPLSALESLEIVRQPELSQADMAVIGKLKSLRRLSLLGTPVTQAASFGELTNLPRLETLKIHLSVRFSDQALLALSKLPVLERMVLATCTAVTDAGLAHLSGLRTLHQLEVSANANITGEGLKALKGLPDLERLSLRQCSKIDAAAAKVLAEFQALRTLDLSRTGVGDDGMEALTRITTLSSLSLHGLWQISEQGVRQLAKCSKLATLNLSGCTRIPASALPLLADLKELAVLKLDECTVNAATLTALKDLPIQELSLAAGSDGTTSLTPDSLALLAEWKSLKHLALSRQPVNTEVLEALSELALVSLTLDGCANLSADTLTVLKDYASLASLSLRACPGLRESDLSALREAKPELKVVFSAVE